MGREDCDTSHGTLRAGQRGRCTRFQPSLCVVSTHLARRLSEVSHVGSVCSSMLHGHRGGGVMLLVAVERDI